MPERLAEILLNLGRPRVVVVGDVILDRYVWGEVERISPEAPIPVLAVAKEETSLGGAASVVQNLVALGVLSAGISEGLAAARRRDYEKFSALRRAGTPDEAARVIAWLALENSYIQGKVIAVNGGI